MSSRANLAASGRTSGEGSWDIRENSVRIVALSWGLCAFFPIGVMYLNLLLMLTALAIAPDWLARVLKLRRESVVLPIALMVAWTLLAGAVGDWFPDTATRLFHVVRVALVLCIGLMLTPSEARMALAGFMLAAVFAALLVCAHHIWGMPDWAIWNGLLSSRNSFSSGNMITLATACGVYFFLGILKGLQHEDRWPLLGAGLALAIVVALHAVSRNSQLLLVLLLMTAVVCRFRSLRAAVAGLAVVVALAGSMWQFSPGTQSRFHELLSNLRAAEVGSSYATSGGVRWRMYQEAAQGMAAHPVFGMGVGSWLPHWRTVWMELEKDGSPAVQRQFSEINNPHNDFLLAGMETGVPGMLILIWLMARFVRTGWRQYSAAGSITVVMGVSVFATAVVNAPFRDAAFGMTLLWLLAVSVAAHGEVKP
ncbi:MAG: O-antigen ligase family protein [Candidatus Saccharibacteria bacterium]|nr:O-antigen ligase family protein [Rhodoferax sp.]